MCVNFLIFEKTFLKSTKNLLVTLAEREANAQEYPKVAFSQQPLLNQANRDQNRTLFRVYMHAIS